MKKPPHYSMSRKNLENLLKTSKKVKSFVGPKYTDQYQSMIREIEEQHQRNAEKMARTRNEVIGSGLARIRKKQ